MGSMAQESDSAYRSASPTWHAPPTGSTARARGILLTLTGITHFTVYLFISFLGPFFTEYAEARYNSTALEVGAVFGLYPLAKSLGSPVASILCEKWGRLTVWMLGLLLLASAAVMFALGDSMILYMVSRIIKGFAGALCVVASTATVITHSNNLTRDIGFLETLGGIGYMLGPAVGGLLYSSLGLRGMFLYSTVFPFLLMPFIVASFWAFGYRQRSETATKKSSEPQGQDFQRWKEVSSEGAVMVCVTALIGNAMAWAFMDLALALHLEAVLNTSTQLTGFIMSLPALSYTIIAPLMPRICRRVSMRTALLLGLAFLSLSSLLLGPSPPLTFLVPNLPMAWTTICFCLLLTGVGSGLIVVPAIPMMLEAMQEKRPEDADAYNDIISGVFHSGWSAGDFVGPLIGGYLLQRLPPTLEPLCKATSEHPCQSTFGWVTTFYATFLAACWILIVIASRLEGMLRLLFFKSAWGGLEKNKEDRGEGDTWLTQGILTKGRSSSSSEDFDCTV